jgi:hypothetical protein
MSYLGRKPRTVLQVGLYRDSATPADVADDDSHAVYCDDPLLALGVPVNWDLRDPSKVS